MDLLSSFLSKIKPVHRGYEVDGVKTMNLNDLISAQDACLLGISINIIGYYIGKKELATIRIGGRRYLDREQVIDWFKQKELITIEPFVFQCICQKLKLKSKRLEDLINIEEAK